MLFSAVVNRVLWRRRINHCATDRLANTAMASAMTICRPSWLAKSVTYESMIAGFSDKFPEDGATRFLRG